MKTTTPNIVIILVLFTTLLFTAGCDSPPGAVAGDKDAGQATTRQQEHDDEAGDHGHADDHDDHGEAGHDHDEAGHGEEGHDEVVHLTAAQMEEFGIRLAVAGPGRLTTQISLPGEVRLNQDTMAHIVPPVGGVVRRVAKGLGDRVAKGEVLAELASRELADLKVAYLAARERHELARQFFLREETLWRQKITAEQEYLTAKQALAEAEIELRAAAQRLYALGFTAGDLRDDAAGPDTTFTRFRVTAPFAGTVIEKHVTLGEVVKEDTELFVIADLDTVWVELSVYQKDLPLVRQGQEVTIEAGHGLAPARGTISYLGPMVGEATRTAPARVVLPNRDGRWRPGMFVTAKVDAGSRQAAVVVPKDAVVRFEDRPTIFVADEDGIEPRAVETGMADEQVVEIVAGLAAGTRYVAEGAFTVKAQLSKGSFGDGHNH